jgi:hypothetical protein
LHRIAPVAPSVNAAFSPAQATRYRALLLETWWKRANSVGAERTVPGSLNALIVKYYRSPEFRGLKASTQAARRSIIETFRHQHGTKPVARLTRVHIKEIIGAKADTPEAANSLLKALRVILTYAVEDGMLANNPAVALPPAGEAPQPVMQQQ